MEMAQYLYIAGESKITYKDSFAGTVKQLQRIRKSKTSMKLVPQFTVACPVGSSRD